MTTPELCQKIFLTRFAFVDEKRLQDGVSLLLDSLSVPYLKEHSLSPQDRIDFLLGTTGIEVKIKGSLAALTRQLWRYAQDPQITELIVITARIQHTQLPDTIMGKPLHVVHLIHSML